MIIDNSGVRTSVKESRKIIEFCFDRSDYFVLTRRHAGGVPFENLKTIVQQKIEEIEATNNENMMFLQNATKQELKKYGLNSKADLMKQFKNQAREMTSIVKSYLYEYKDEEDLLERNLQEFGLCKRKICIGEFFDYLNIWDICYFDKYAIDYSNFLVDVFHQPVQLGKYMFKNIGFANSDEQIWMKVFSSHGYFQMELEEEQFRSFIKQGISYTLLDS